MKKYKPEIIAGLSLLIGAIIFLNANLPISHIDDFYFFGVAENLLKVGELENPYFTEEYFEGLNSKKFYFQPPFYPWLIAIWMGAFGINSISIPLFSFFITSIGALSVWVIGRFFSVQWPTLLCTVLAYYLCMARLGLRPEVAAFSFFFLGAYLLIRYRVFPLVPIFLLGLSVAFYPLTLVPSFLVIGTIFYLHYSDDLKKSLFFILQGSLAALILIFIFAALIDFQFSDFFSTYLIVAQAQNPGPPFTIERFIRYVEMLSSESRYLPKWPYIALATLVYLILLTTRKIQGFFAIFLGILLLSCVGAGGLTHLRAIEFTTFIAFLILFFIVGHFIKNRFAFYSCITFLLSLMIIANLLTVSHIFLQRPIPTNDQKLLLEEISLISKNKPRALIDSHVARYIYGWQIPKGFKDFYASRPLLESEDLKIFPRIPENLYDNEFVILSKCHARDGWSNQKPKTVAILGHQINQIPCFYCEPFITDRSK